jgi:hypothetical protein
MLRLSIVVLSVFVGCGFLTPLACAQQTEQLPVPISIRVIDPSKAVVSDACVTIESLSPKFNLSKQANASGSLSVELRPGQYKITVRASGFMKTSIPLEVKASSPPVIQIQLPVGSCAQCLEVQAAKPGQPSCPPCGCT